MSARIVNQNVIGFIVNAAIQYQFIDPSEAPELGNMLWQENQKSVHHRYGHEDDDYGNIGVFTKRMELGVFEDFNPSQVISSCKHYEYHACEHRDWLESEAYKFIARLIKEATRNGGEIDHESTIYGAPDPIHMIEVDKVEDVGEHTVIARQWKNQLLEATFNG